MDGLYMDHIWIIYGSYMDYIWIMKKWDVNQLRSKPIGLLKESPIKRTESLTS